MLRNQYGDRIRHAKRDHWNACIEEADTCDVWTIGKFVRAGSSDGGKGSIPPMRRPGSDTTTRQSEEKGKIFFDTFFPAPPPEAARRLRETYPDNVFEFANVLDAQIVAACKRLKEFKAPGPDGIPNKSARHALEKRASNGHAGLQRRNKSFAGAVERVAGYGGRDETASRAIQQRLLLPWPRVPSLLLPGLLALGAHTLGDALDPRGRNIHTWSAQGLPYWWGAGNDCVGLPPSWVLSPEGEVQVGQPRILRDRAGVEEDFS
ncbi:uncharacterized protein C8Q71DRAFT_885640 [Rhodofomes roseus]|uniref:Uncharacterized protein n=1 Tax=Rhodofomes roseus TaxID=34475 RepID=A0ABQ8K268_9APHY|nr:uncharacterized protein C8Q71DRAFT_885640 [Rhodofomes roseus]KAH9830560.1 hypothetical protein C8Q71DRAFT_885640 [Rhodofomes roseus]